MNWSNKKDELNLTDNFGSTNKNATPGRSKYFGK